MMNRRKSLALISSQALAVLVLTIVANGTTQLALAEDTEAWSLDRPLVPFKARYSVGNNTLVAGRADIELTQIEPSMEWQYSLTTKPTGLFRLTGKGNLQESARFQIVDENNALFIQPKTYTFRQDNKQSRAIDATFIWSQKQLYFKRGDDNGVINTSANTLDRMTMIVAMMSNLTAESDTVIMSSFDSGKLKELQLANEGLETIKTALGDVETVRVRRTNLAGSTRETITWFAPSLNYVPVRIEQLKNGDLVARLSISEYNPESQP